MKTIISFTILFGFIFLTIFSLFVNSPVSKGSGYSAMFFTIILCVPMYCLARSNWENWQFISMVILFVILSSTFGYFLSLAGKHNTYFVDLLKLIAFFAGEISTGILIVKAIHGNPEPGTYHDMNDNEGKVEIKISSLI